MRGISDTKSASVERFRPLSHGAKITHGMRAIPVQQGRDFCTLTGLYNGSDFPDV
jgi:hypothetical protein